MPQDTSIGETLRRTREARGLSVAEVANTLKLNLRQIEALESGRFDLLPGFAFTRGFLRNYARLLKIDAAPLLESLQSPEGDGVPELAPASNAGGQMPQVGRGRFRRSVLPGVLAALTLFGIVVAGWYYDLQRKKPAEELVASLPSSTAAEATPAAEPASVTPLNPPLASTVETPSPAAAPASAPVAVVAPPVAEAPPAAEKQPSSPVVATAQAPATAAPVAAVAKPGTEHLVFQFEKDAWVEVKDKDGKILFSQLGKAGSRQEVEGRVPLSLTVGNARFVKLERNGAPVDLGLSGKITVARLKLE